MTATGPGTKESLAIGNTIAEMAKVADFVDRFGAAHGISPAVINKLNVCLDELLNNTISYGYKDQAPHSIAVSLSLSDGRLVAEIVDDGEPFDPGRATSPPPSGPLASRKIGGLGLHLINTLMDEVGYVRMGSHNVVTLAKRLQP